MKKKTLSVLALIAALAVTGCSGNQSETPTEPGSLTPITVAAVPVADVAPLYLGVEEGFFEEEGLDVTVKNVQGAAAAVPLLLNGEMQFAYGAVIPLVSIVASGVPAVFVTGGIARPDSPETDYSAVVTAKNSPIADLRSLSGHSVAVNALRGGPHLSVLVALEQAGVDPASVDFIELPMGDGLAAVERGDVDAAYLAEPFTSKARKSGFPVISSPVYETAPEGATSGYFTVQPYLEGHGDIVDAFARAMAKSVEYANSHPDKVRAQIAEYTGLDAAAIEGMIIPTFTAELTQSGLDTMIGQLQDQGWLDTVPDAASMVRE